MPVTATAVIDQAYMQRALKLASLGKYTTTPNPNVGCVIVDDNSQIVGEGFHQLAGTPHAEVHAMRQAGDKTRGATVYVTLEPCSHHGRTGPCADALIEAGAKRVVVAMQDPNPRVAGNGIQRLRDAGIAVDVGCCEADARALNRGFLRRMETGRPFVTLKLAATLDGRTALANGASQWITGADARRDVHRLRATSCAILTGADTVLVDDPQLNVRIDKSAVYPHQVSELEVRQPIRVIVDGKNRLRPELQIFQSGNPVIVANLTANPVLVESTPVAPQQWQVVSASGYVDLAELLSRLGEHEINSVWVEAGATLAGALLNQKLVDEVILYQAPKVMGQYAQALFNIAEQTDMNELPQFSYVSVERVGEDVKLVLVPKY
ncbi:bifunctional diaminohydroxyphosphoribosylaminopyrimidine deaminase/5-amino-6-(5-phosphoribosylamino)uracil reductase RibD [Alteromonas sp. ASW11-36]|uniref:Riboflavin biosynthesis protein RibD n=1 Tax=Alteromonas arenosi TaxID=3055817 RepID=A0ABT7SUT9_9ALTE|nr:bifunctional diaminohydroxyphosphoribosylaminopyrimidine deaminase/5-amino-6-(5-phosphoribosylamino)uracil reductase RibD [Alteromonas sp. ASW11-36]MDM7859774.1 bifunctional diaminohydroxyphosphoribosylaminopyrimidine deaminase/5-amino-6-(5-phosphoribosylamino)uracil reductase RibD [Alteromonas sp. ASW11-36]